MKLKHFFRLTLFFHLMFTAMSHKKSTEKNTTQSVNVLVAVFPPFSYFDKDRDFFGGIDVVFLKTIGNRLGYQLVFDQTDSLNSISMEKFE